MAEDCMRAFQFIAEKNGDYLKVDADVRLAADTILKETMFSTAFDDRGAAMPTETTLADEVMVADAFHFADGDGFMF
ncbi:hypothetical protein HKCCE2091_07780 [Rhodobacterales bacterium HKCCE2091]|nr:hypothetical protein [Rhodobacterales bacterium HKCCE2091]